MSYVVITDSGELYHHGIKGQQWGVQNGPPYPLASADRKKIQKRLNKLESKKAQAYADRERALKKEMRAAVKGNSKKFEKSYNKRELAEHEAFTIEEEIQNIVKNATESGLSVDYVATPYVVDKGRNFVISAITGGQIISVSTIPGRKYTVKENANKAPKENTNTAQKEIKDTSKASILNRAKNEGKYSLDFLESIQNSKIFNDGNSKAMLNEYSKYLDNPDKYIREDAYKLKQV